MPYLIAALLVRAALRHKHGHGGHGEWGHGRHGWGEWRGPKAHGERGHRGGWRHGRWGHEGAEPRGPRSEVGALMTLLRDAFHHGGIDARQAEEIRAVFREAGRRITAILAETPTPTKMV